MEVTLTPEQESALDRIVQTTGRDKSQLLREAVDHWLAYEDQLQQLRAEIQAGIDDIEQGRYREFSSKESLMQFADEVHQRALQHKTGRRR